MFVHQKYKNTSNTTKCTKKMIVSDVFVYMYEFYTFVYRSLCTGCTAVDSNVLKGAASKH